MKINQFFALLILLFSLSCTKKVHNVNGNDALDKSLLWEVSGKELKEPSYIFGTIHMIPSVDYFLPKGTLNSIDKSAEMWFEIDMAEMNNMSNMMSIVSKLFMKDNTTLKDLLSNEDYTKVSNHFKNIGIPMMMLDRVKPMFLSIFATGDISPMDMQTGKIKSYELEFFEIAQSKKMKTGGLESIDFQIGLFDSISYIDQAKILMEQMNVSDKDNEEFKALLDIYKKQDIVRLYNETVESDGLKNSQDALINKRNMAWIPLMIKQSKSKPTFYAVGAGHLAGKNGVLTLLKNAGYKVRAISSE
jgi:hypothetical protein